MGCVQSNPEDLQNRAIQRAQLDAKKKSSEIVTLFLVGSGDSGKSTLLKQLANLNTAAYSDPLHRKRYFKSVIYDNLFDGAFTLIEADPKLVTSQELQVLESHARSHILPKEVADILIRIFKLQLEHENLQDCFKVFSKQFAQEYPVWGGDEWIPSVEECVRSRIRTTGVVKQEFEIQSVPFQIIDVGGQKAERRKWLHKFEDVDALIFMVALSEYDKCLFEDKKKNRLQDSLELFEQISKSEFVQDKPMLLYLNKRDLFQVKVKKVPLSSSGIPGAPNKVVSEEEAVEWVKNEFRKRRPNQKDLICHVTCATDSSNVKAVFDSSRVAILRNRLAYL